MFQKLMIISKGWSKLKLVLHSMQVLKFGEINLMEVNLIFGLLAVFCIKCVALNRLFMEKI